MGGALRAALADFTDEELRTALQVIRTATASLTELESTLPAQDSAAEPREDAREAS